jgi:hypothetical protein
MNESLKLKQNILSFLSDHTFEKSQFKQIYHSFIQFFPEFRSKKYYQKIYQIIRELEQYRVFEVDRSSCTYKYSTIGNRQILLNLIHNTEDKDSLQKQLLSDYHRANSKLHKIKAELEIFNKYMSLYPKIKEKISIFTTERNQLLLMLESELSAIDIILENI